jgi:GT2 family glycosyltransferase
MRRWHSFIGPCLDSLMLAANAHDEIVVVDNASTDGSLATLQQRSNIRLVSLSTTLISSA